jgi:hypothetical protein
MTEETGKIKERILMKLRGALTQSFSPEFLRDVKLESREDFWNGNWLTQLRTFVWAEKLEDILIPVRFDFPKNWWEHLKKRLGFSFRKKTLEKVINLQRYAKYPDYRPLPPEVYGDMKIHELILGPFGECGVERDKDNR